MYLLVDDQGKALQTYGEITIDVLERKTIFLFHIDKDKIRQWVAGEWEDVEYLPLKSKFVV